MQRNKAPPRRARTLSSIETPRKNKINLEFKSQLITFNFFQNLLNADEFSRSIVYSLIDSLTIKNYDEDEVISTIYNIIDTVFFLIKGSIANYEKIPKHIHTDTIPNNLINEGHVFGFETDNYEYTSKTLTKCTIGHLSRDLFMALVNKHHQYSLKHELSFFFNLPYLKGIRRSNISFLVANSQKLQFKRGNTITVQGHPCDSIFIVRQGQIKISYMHTVNHCNDFDIDYFESISSISDRFSTPRKVELLSSYNEKKLLSLIIITNGDMIGDFELKSKAKTYYFNSNCELDNSIVYRFDMELFKRILLEKNHLNFLRYLIQKEKLFLDRLNTALRNTKKKQNKYALRILEKTPEVNGNERQRRLKSSSSHFNLITKRKVVINGTFDLNKMSNDVYNGMINHKPSLKKLKVNPCSRNQKKRSLFTNANIKNKLALFSIERFKIITPTKLTISPSLKLFKTNVHKQRKNILNKLNKKTEDNNVENITGNNRKDIKSLSLGFELNKLIHGNNDSNVFNHKLNSFLMSRNHSHLFYKTKSN